MKSIKFILNGDEVETEVRDDMMLLELLREKLSLTGTKEGCGEGECGACTVLVDGLNVDSCLYPAMEIEGKEVVTIEGLSENGELSAIQKSFLENGGVQCGFCTPGMIMASLAAINEKKRELTKQEAKEAISGNLCRCTGYVKIVEAEASAILHFSVT